MPAIRSTLTGTMTSRLGGFLHRTIATALFSTAQPLASFTDAIVSERALSYRTLELGFGSSSEDLAELIVRNSMSRSVMLLLQSPVFVSSAVSALFPTRTTRIASHWKYLSDQSVSEAVEKAIRDTDIESPPGLLMVMTHLFSQAISKLDLVEPHRAKVSVTLEADLFPGYESLVEGVKVKKVADILDAMQIEPGAFSRASNSYFQDSLAAVLRETFSRASLQLRDIDVADYKIKFAFVAVKRYLLRQRTLPMELVDNVDLMQLALNFTVARAALSQDDFSAGEPGPLLYERALQDLRLSLKQTRRFRTIPLSEVRNMFATRRLFDVEHRRLAGIGIALRYSTKATLQALFLNKTTQSASPGWDCFSEPQVENMLMPYIAALATPQVTDGSVFLDELAQLTVIRHPEFATERLPAEVFLVNGTTEDELSHLAASFAPSIMLAATDGGEPVFVFNVPVPDGEYHVGGSRLGDLVQTADPAEAVMLTAPALFDGTSSYEPRLQVLSPDALGGVLFTQPSTFSGRLSPVAASMPMTITVGGEVRKIELNLQKLLLLGDETNWSIVRPPALGCAVASRLEMLVYLANRYAPNLTEITEEGVVHEKAVYAMVQLLRMVSNSAVGQQLTIAVARQVASQLRHQETDPSVVRTALQQTEFFAFLRLQLAILMMTRLQIIDDKLASQVDVLVTSAQSIRLLVMDRDMAVPRLW